MGGEKACTASKTKSGRDREVRIVVIEDDANDRELLSHQLRECKMDEHIKFISSGKETLDFSTGPRGKSVAKNLVAIFLDLNLPDKGGKTYPVNPGQIRPYDVNVGVHLAPPPAALGKFLARFQSFYDTYRRDATPQAVIAAMAAHHRLAWIHPFGDGNGRVTRLLTHAWLTRIGLGANGLWTLSRGLARGVDQYKEVLAAADNKRLNDYDGRGYLSERRLAEFCSFMIDGASDQINFMHELLDFRQLEKRLLSYCAVAEQARDLPKGSGVLLRDVMLRGTIPRGEAARILNVSARTAQAVIGTLLAKGLLKSPSPKGQLTIAFPGFICPSLFPDLYPAGSPAYDLKSSRMRCARGPS